VTLDFVDAPYGGTYLDVWRGLDGYRVILNNIGEVLCIRPLSPMPQPVNETGSGFSFP